MFQAEVWKISMSDDIDLAYSVVFGVYSGAVAIVNKGS